MRLLFRNLKEEIYRFSLTKPMVLSLFLYMDAMMMMLLFLKLQRSYTYFHFIMQFPSNQTYKTWRWSWSSFCSVSFRLPPQLLEQNTKQNKIQPTRILSHNSHKITLLKSFTCQNHAYICNAKQWWKDYNKGTWK